MSSARISVSVVTARRREYALAVPCNAEAFRLFTSLVGKDCQSGFDDAYEVTVTDDHLVVSWPLGETREPG